MYSGFMILKRGGFKKINGRRSLVRNKVPPVYWIENKEALQKEMLNV